MKNLALALSIVAALAGCARDPEPNRVLVLGLDGVDPDVIDLLVSEGKLPHFARLEKEGAAGRLLSEKPLLSPVIWTTIATGKTPDRHGIGGFTAVNPKTGESLPVTSRMRRVQSLWNIFSDAGRNVAVVGWWATWPPEPVRGGIVSDHASYHFLFREGFEKGKEAVTHPPELQTRIAPLLPGPGDLGPTDLAPFVDVAPEELARPFDFQDDLSHFRWALATARGYRDAGLKLWREDRPGLAMVYIESPDTASHLFGHLFRTQGLAGELAEQQRRYGRAVEAMYVFADRIVGDFLEAMDDRTTLVVLSDHGFTLGALPDDPTRTRDLRRVSERSHEMEGILYLYGAGVKAGSRIEGPRLVDVTPTILALAGLPAGRDMRGRVLSEGLTVSEPERIATYETGKAKEQRAREETAADRALLEHLGSLGYLNARSPSGDRNLAAIYFRQGRLEESARLYGQLVAEKPDDAPLRASYAGVLGRLGRYAEAREQLEKGLEIDPLNPEARHNLGVLHEKEGREKDAVAAYRNAVRCDTRYEPSRRALLRLTGSEEPDPPSSDVERRAFELAQRAADTARRGDYDGAESLLEKAGRLAPRYPLVYQYRSNVAFLKGDVAGAVAALERAVELQPENVLYRENLRRLRGRR